MALPKYPELKRTIEKKILLIFEEVAKNELGPFKDVRRFTQHEGDLLVHNTLDDSKKFKETDYKQVEVTYEIKPADLIKMSPEDIMEFVKNKAVEFGGEQAKLNYKVLNDTTEETGNVVNAGGKPISVDLFLETISKISIGFDKFGNPQMPTMVVSSSQADKFREFIEKADKDEDAKKRFDELIAQKKEEYNAEQASRKLVD